MAALGSAYDLVEDGLLSDAARAIDQFATATRDLQVLRAYLECHIGTASNAKSRAQRLLQGPLSPREKTVCWEVIGRTNLSGGRIPDGLRAMSKAVGLANSGDDSRLQARLIASYTESLLHWVGTEPAILEMPKLRRAAVRAGDPFSLIEFHYLSAEINAKKGLLVAATMSIRTARGLLDRFPNVAQRGRLAVFESGLAAAHSDFESSERNAHEALDCASRSGLRILRLPALNNLVYIKLVQKRFSDAREYLDDLLQADLEDNPTEIGYRDTQMMLALATNDFDLAVVAANRITELTTSAENRESYYALWHVPNQIRWLYRIGQLEEGIQKAREAIARVEKSDDRSLLARLLLLAADGCARRQRDKEAQQDVVAAVRLHKELSIEVLAETLRVTGRITAQENPPAAQTYFRHAQAILHGLGNLAAQQDVERDAAETLPVLSSPNLESLTSSRVIERISTLVDLGTHVPTLASEGFSLIVDSDSCYRGSLICANSSGAREVVSEYKSADCPSSTDSQKWIIEVGSFGNKRFEIECLPKHRSSDQQALMRIERLIHAAIAVASLRDHERERSAAWSTTTTERHLGLLCSSERMIELVNTVRRVGTSEITALLTGETGVGKELFARALHLASQRNDKTFLPFNCGTVPRDLIDSQLFGHRRGAFTGAHADSPGVIRSAAGGTLFLDEIGEMAIETQPKLLRFLESGEILPLGETKPQLVDVRIVAATNANLDQMVADGRFREDLYYRLNVIRINIPPLRERREEIPALTEHFLEMFGREFQKPMLRVADETLEYLVLYRWPGNVRQLANELRRMVALAEPGAVLMPAHLSDDIVASRRTMPVGHAPRGFSEVVTRIDQPLSAAVEHIERATIQRALSMADGNLVEAARMLGLSRKGLYLKRQRLKLD